MPSMTTPVLARGTDVQPGTPSSTQSSPSVPSLSPPTPSGRSPQHSSLVTIPPSERLDGALSRIEDLLESIVDALSGAKELIIPYRVSRGGNTVSNQREDRQHEFVRFPGRNIQEAQRFEAVFRIIEMSHEALLAGTLITKRNIYYQNVELFKSQSVVDDMVDNIALTLGVGREDLNIVAAAKGLIAGPVALHMRSGDVVHCDLSTDHGILLPSIHSVEKVDFNATAWLLVIEKEATFRTLAASQYPSSCAAGPGIIVTGKGFPDLATRRFLCILHSARPELAMFALVDYDPHGIAIFRTYKHGSKRLDHEENLTVPGLRWLGVQSRHVLTDRLNLAGNGSQASTYSEGSSQDSSSQGSFAYSQNTEENPTRKRRRLQRTDSNQVLASLTPGDRKKAVEVMRDIYDNGEADAAAREQFGELQRMLLLNIKAEIQALDDFGNITDWLTEALGAA